MLNRLFGMQPTASEHGYQIDQMLEFVHWIMLLLFIGWTTFFIFTLIRFHRSRNPKADYHGVRSRASSHIEIMVVVVVWVFLVGFGIPLWSKRVNGPKPEEGVADRVRLIAEQYKWNFHYPGKDGVFGRQDINLISAANPIGLDRSDPAAQDDLVAINEMHLPVRRNVIVDTSSKDVIHSFAVPIFRVGQDTIPGMVIPTWFKPVRTGEYEIVCGQLCGYGHYAMKGLIVVDTEEDYKKWYEGQLSLTAGLRTPAPEAPAPAAPAAPATEAAPAAPAAPAPAPAEPAAPAAPETPAPEPQP